MATGVAIESGNAVLIQAGNGLQDANLALSLIVAEQISLSASGHLQDVNGSGLNVQAVQVALRADQDGNGIGAIADPTNPLEIAVDVLAASSAEGIYIHQLAEGGDLAVSYVDAIEVIARTESANFNSTRTLNQETTGMEGLSDLTTGAPTTTSPIAVSLVVEGGDVRLLEGADADAQSVEVRQSGSISVVASTGSIARPNWANVDSVFRQQSSRPSLVSCSLAFLLLMSINSVTLPIRLQIHLKKKRLMPLK